MKNHETCAVTSRRRPTLFDMRLLLSATIILVVVHHRDAGADELGAREMVAENALPGASSAVWDVEGAGDPTLQGFATEISVNRGETIQFKIDTDADAYRIDLYRVGYYAGAGARLVTTVPSSQTVAIAQPECLTDSQTGLIDCGNWEVSAEWAVPTEAKSGVYVARLVREDNGGASHVMFIVRDDASRSDILLQTSDTTWQAYNDYGGNSLYSGAPAGRAYKVSYNRPMVLRGNTYSRASFWANEYPTIRWLEANGYDVSYTSGVDTARRGELLKQHKVFMSVGHDEYWSADQRANVEMARDAGVHLAFLSGNAVFWKTRWEPAIDATSTPWRTLVTYKETHAAAKIDPSSSATGTWRDPRFSLPDDGRKPENAFKGSLFVANCCRFDSIVVSAEQGRYRIWRHTDAARLGAGQSLSVGERIVGYEWDGDTDNGFRPPGLIRLSATAMDIGSALLDYGSEYGAWPATHNLTLYKHSSGALVFSAGTILWGWALDQVHDDPDAQSAPVDRRVQQVTVNLLADMSVFPAALNDALISSEASTDFTPPLATIDTPSTALMNIFQLFLLPVTISGLAVDEGGQPAGVEISTDSGATWHAATGAARWTYKFPLRDRLTTVLARAIDDSGNIQPIPTHTNIRLRGFRYRDEFRWAVGVLWGVLLPVLLLFLYLDARRKHKNALS